MVGELGGGVNGYVASVVIPAHNEAAVIGRLLQALHEGGDDQLEVVVACNGCTDDTATIASDHGVRVVKVEQASKTAALNAADEVATTFPRVYVDADIVLPGSAVRQLTRALDDPDVLFAAPPLVVDTRGRPWPVRAYFAVWQRTPYVRVRQVGAGVYALSAAGRGRFDRFPSVIADDLFARDLFASDERTIVPIDPIVVEAPWTLRALVRRRIRVYAGNLQLATDTGLPPLPGANEHVGPWWRAVVDHPRLIASALCYASVNVFAKTMARWRLRRTGTIDWGRDSTTRGPTSRPVGTEPS